MFDTPVQSIIISNMISPFGLVREINAFIYDATVLEYLAGHDDSCKLRTVGNWYAMTGYGIGFPKGSKWIDRINKHMIQFQHDGQQLYCYANAF